MNKIKTSVFSTFALLPLIGYAASFNCAVAQNDLEIAICDDPALSEADEKMESIFKRIKEVWPDVTNSQREWIAERNACDSSVCMRAAYHSRIAVLENLEAALTPRSPEAADFLWEPTAALRAENASDIIKRASPTLAALGIGTKEVGVLMSLTLLSWFPTRWRKSRRT